jgi:hypothetical protein
VKYSVASIHQPVQFRAAPLDGDRELGTESAGHRLQGADGDRLEAIALDAPDPPTRDTAHASKICLPPTASQSQLAERGPDAH